MDLKQACIRYGNNFLSEKREQENLYYNLLEAAFSKRMGSGTKRTGITCYGAPLIYSFKYKTGKQEKKLRTVMELFGEHISVSEQIEWSLEWIKTMITQLKWKTDLDLDQVLAVVYPKNRNETNNWISGMWLGMDFDASVETLKIYLNLRHQSEEIRWKKLENFLRLYENTTLYYHTKRSKLLKDLLEVCYKKALPVGIGLAISTEGLLGIRIYFALAKINETYIKEISNRFFSDEQEGVSNFLKLFQYTCKTDTSSIVCLDFLMDHNGQIIYEPIRMKVEVSACRESRKEQEILKEFIQRQMETMGLPYAEFCKDLQLAKECFEEIFFQYISLGIGRKDRHFTVYFEPV